MSLMSGWWNVFKCRQCNCQFAITQETDKDGEGYQVCPECDAMDAEYLGEELID